MNIAVDTTPLISDHKVRGTGFYVHRLTVAFKKYFPEHTYTFFSKRNEIPKNADIIHYPYFDPFSLTVPIDNSRKTIITVLDLTPIVFPNAFPAGIKGNLKWQLQKLALKKVAGILTLSNASKNDIIRFVGIPEEKIRVVYLAAGEKFMKVNNQDQKLKIIKEKYNLPDKFALYVGDVTWNKNLPRLVEAATAAKIPLVMVGKALVNEKYDKGNLWNSDIIKVQSFAKENKFIKRIGFVVSEDLNYLYNLATVFVMPSLYEGFGLPILEAMQCGCPVITAKEGSIPEVAGTASYFVDAYSKDSIAKGLEEVFSSQKLQEELSGKGLKQTEKFSWEKTASETLLFYKSILQSNKKT